MFRGLPEPPDELKAALNYPTRGVGLATGISAASRKPVPVIWINHVGNQKSEAKL
jgi:hypothetical protein